MLTLRSEQMELVKGVRAEFANGCRSVLAVGPTGFGKTVVFSYIAENTTSRGKRVSILVHRFELLKQTSNKLKDFGVDHGLIQARFTPDYSKKAQVISVQTLIKRLQKLPSPDLIIIDEAHHAVAGTWMKIIEAFPNSFVLGVTATPIRTDGRGLGKTSGGIFESMVLGPSFEEQIKQGYLVQPVVFFPKSKLDLSDVKKKYGDYDKNELEIRVDKSEITGDVVAHYSKISPGEPAIVFCISIAHAQHVAQQFRDAGYSFYAVDGAMEADDRDNILGGLGTTIQGVCSCDLIGEGLDVPKVRTIINLRLTNSLGLILQQWGRGSRPVYADGFDLSTRRGRLAAIAASEKPNYYILDHVGNVLLHGLPEEEREWTLDGIKKRKKKGLSLENVKFNQCPTCYNVHSPTPVCPHCNHVYEVKSKDIVVTDGELQIMTADDVIKIKRNRMIKIKSAKSIEELQAIGQELGYKPGWAKHEWNSRISNRKLKGGEIM